MKKQKTSNKLKILTIVLCVQLCVLGILMVNADKLGTMNNRVVSVVENSGSKDKEEFDDKKISNDKEEGTTEEIVTEEPTTIDNTLYEVCLIAVGDNLISDSVTHCGLQADGSYEFSELYEELKSDIEVADLAIINQETILGGPDFEYTGYPNFNNPYEIGNGIIDAGFDVVLQATNHSMDMGAKGAENCINYWKEHPEVTMIGMYGSFEEQEKIAVVEKNNIKIAILNYTYGLNGYSLPDGKEYLVNLIDEDRIVDDLKRAEEIADFTIVCPHWGVEYVHEPNTEQIELAQLMVKNGADLILGAHPHVLETIEWIEADNGNKGLCYYSLGNYTSSQDKTSTMLGGMAKLTIQKRGNEVKIKEGAGIIPIATHYIWGSGRLTKTYRLTEYTEELARVHSIHSVTSGFSVDKLNEIAEEVVGDWIVE